MYWKVFFTVLITDLITKYFADFALRENTYEILPFLKVFLIHNRGAAFGMFSDFPEWIRVPLLVITPLIALVITYLYSKRTKDKITKVALAMIGGGAIGNLYDRLIIGEVRDFIHLHVGEFYWPAFNLADASITVGIFVLIFKGWIERK